MWDEEGLEPLGGAATTASINSNGNTTHHIGSFDSDLNSIVSRDEWAFIDINSIDSVYQPDSLSIPDQPVGLRKCSASF